MLFARRSTLIAFSLVALLWGATYAIVKLTLDHSPPVLFASLRMLAGGVVMTLCAFLWGGPLDFRKTWPIFFFSAILNALLFIGLQSVALVYLPSGLTAVLIYTQPIFVGVMAWLWLGESLTPSKLAGLILGFIGVVLISFHRVADSFSLVGLFFGLSTALGWAFGTIYLKKIEGKVPLLWLSGIQLLIAGTILLPVALSFESWQDISWTLPFWMGLLYSGLCGSALAWFLWAYIVKSGEASRVSAYMFVVPFISVLIGILFLREAFGLNLLAGAALILFGIYLVNKRQIPLAQSSSSKANTPSV